MSTQAVATRLKSSRIKEICFGFCRRKGSGRRLFPRHKAPPECREVERNVSSGMPMRMSGMGGMAWAAAFDRRLVEDVCHV